MPRFSFRIFASAILASTAMASTASAQITRCEQGPIGGPYVSAGEYGKPLALQWNPGPPVSIPPGGAREIRCVTEFGFSLDLVGTDLANFTYDSKNSVRGGGGCAPAFRCALFLITCDDQFKLRGPKGSDGEQSDALEICTLPGANQACRSIGRWDCDKQQTALLTPATPLTLLTPWGDGLIVPTFGGAATNITVSNAFPLSNPTQVPSGFLPITEAVTLAPAGLPVPGATLTIRYSDGEIRGGVESTVTAFAFDTATGVWVPTPSITDVDNNTITIQVNQFGTYGFTAAPAMSICDVDLDGDIDTLDTGAILSARGKAVSAGDPRDADTNLTITAADAKICIAKCSRPRCVP